jgi:hypothetical protein
MKKICSILFCAGLLLLSTTCRKALKDPQDYYPEVQTISAIVTPEGAVEVTAEIISTGETPIAYAGFCMSTEPLPEMLDNQQLAIDASAEKFKAIYEKKYDPARTYYFRSWVANEMGYSYGNVISITNIRATPIASPCSLNKNSSNIGLNGASGTGPAESVYQVTDAHPFSFGWEVIAHGYDAQAGTLKLYFGSQLKTKAYTTVEDSPHDDNVVIHVSSGFTSGYVNEGYKVYVNQLNPGKYEITICDAKWTIDNSTYSTELNARFISPL